MKRLLLMTAASGLAIAATGLGAPTPLAAQTAGSESTEAANVYAALAAQEAERAGEPQFDYELGVAAANAGKYGEAIIALQRVLAVQPDNAAARAELARVYALAGDAETARAQFATVVDDPSLPDPVRRRFTALVQRLDRTIAGGGTDVSGFIEAKGGYDDNINAATDLTTITIPLFSFLGPGTLGAGAVSQEDEFYEINGGVSVVSGLSRQDRLFASALGTWKDNVSSDLFDQASLTGTAGYAHTFASRDVISLSVQAQQFWIDGDDFRTAVGVIGQYTHLLGNGDALVGSAQWTRLDYPTDPLRDADRYALGVGYVTRVLSANVTGGHEETRDRAGDAQSNTFVGASIGAEIPLGSRLALVGGAAFDLRRYDAPDALFLVEREDDRVDLAAGVKFALTDRIFIQPRATYTRNWSNIALYDYERWTVSAALRFEF